MEALKKIQKFPLIVRKVILWILVIIIGIFLIFVWSRIFLKGFKDLIKGGIKNEMMEELRIPSLKEKMKEAMPKFEIPQIPNQNPINNQNPTNSE